MRQKIRSFRQHTKETCGIASILMLLDYYERIQYPTKKMELLRYRDYRSRAFVGVPASFAADALAFNGLKVQLFHSAPDYLINRDDYFEETLFAAIHEEYKTRAEACANRVETRTGMPLDCEILKALLSEGKQVMVQCIVPGDADGIHTEILHWIVVYGWEAGQFLACDPNYGKFRLTEGELEHYMDTPIGRIFLTVREGSLRLMLFAVSGAAEGVHTCTPCWKAGELVAVGPDGKVFCLSRKERDHYIDTPHGRTYFIVR